MLQRYLCDGELAHRPDLQPGSPTTMCNLAYDETTELPKAGQTRAVSGVVERADLSPRGKGEGGKKGQDKSKGVKTAKTKECFCSVTSSESKSEYKSVSAAVKQKFAQRDRTNRHGIVEVDSESDERRCSRVKSMASSAHELDVCFFHGGDDDHGEYLLPLPVIEESDDDCTRQVQPDMSAAEPMDPQAFKPDVQIKPSEEVPVGSKFLSMSDGAQSVGGRLGVRCVAIWIIADKQVTARSQGVWLNCNKGFILDEESAGEVEEPLGDNRGFVESRDQKRVCVVCYRE